MKKIFIYTISLFFLISCGSDTKAPDQVMLIGELYTVSSGDKIIKNSDNAIVKITHIDGKSESTVQLVEGQATIEH